MECKKCKGKLKLIRTISQTTSYEIDDNFNMIPYDNLNSSEKIYFQCSECGRVYNIKDSENTYTQFVEVSKLFLQSYGNIDFMNNGTELKEKDIELAERNK